MRETTTYTIQERCGFRDLCRKLNLSAVQVGYIIAVSVFPRYHTYFPFVHDPFLFGCEDHFEGAV
jgi:hypothetical protein